MGQSIVPSPALTGSVQFIHDGILLQLPTSKTDTFRNVFLFHYPSHLTQPARSLLCNFSFNGTQSQIQIHYFVAHMVPLIASGFSARPHKHCYLPASIPKDTAVIHFVVALQIQHSKREFQGRTSCKWEDGKATQLIDIFLFHQPIPNCSHSQNSSTLILGPHPRFLHHTPLYPHPIYECAIESDNGVSLRREYQASWSDHSDRFGCQRLFSPHSFPGELKRF